jgi:hypothetical protein
MARVIGGTVRICRPRNYFFQVAQDRYLTVFIDRRERGELWTDQVRTFEVAPGQHEVQLGTGWGWWHRSQTLSFEVGPGEIADFACPRFWSSVGGARLRPATEKDLAGVSEGRKDSPKPRNLAEELRNDLEQP